MHYPLLRLDSYGRGFFGPRLSNLLSHRQWTARMIEAGVADRVAAMWRDFIAFHGELDGRSVVQAGSGSVFRDALIDRIGAEDFLGAVLVANDRPGELVGFCLALLEADPLSCSESFARITELYVADGMRRRGGGTCLVTFVIAAMRDQSFRRVEVDALLANEAARSFYGRFGFAAFRERLFVEAE